MKFIYYLAGVGTGFELVHYSGLSEFGEFSGLRGLVDLEDLCGLI